MEADLRYPVGKFHWSGSNDDGRRMEYVAEIESAPARYRAAVEGLSDSQLDTPYRPGGWTVRQVVHHVADSHINSYVRFRLALTESEPTIKPYEEALWAKLPDASAAPVGLSLALLDSLHKRWAILLRSFTLADWARNFRHPEMGLVSLDRNLALYAWHCRHHLAHITRLRERMGW